MKFPQLLALQVSHRRILLKFEQASYIIVVFRQESIDLTNQSLATKLLIHNHRLSVVKTCFSLNSFVKYVFH